MLAKLETLIEFSRKVLLASRESIQWTRIGAALEAFANAERDRRYLVECARLMLAAREENEPLRNLLSAEEWQALKVAAKSKRYALTYMSELLSTHQQGEIIVIMTDILQIPHSHGSVFTSWMLSLARTLQIWPSLGLWSDDTSIHPNLSSTRLYRRTNKGSWQFGRM